MATIIMLQKKIAKALESGEDTAPLLRELAELRIKLNRAVKSRPLKVALSNREGKMVSRTNLDWFMR